jgi:hypothetical protein
MEQQDLNIFENGLNERSKAYLLETTRWTKFIAIMGFIGIGFMIIGGLVIANVSALSGTENRYAGLGAATLGVTYIVLAALYFFPIFLLYKFSKSMKQGIADNNMELITDAFRYQKNLYKYMGIFMIILIAFSLIMIVFAGVMGVMATR